MVQTDWPPIRSGCLTPEVTTVLLNPERYETTWMCINLKIMNKKLIK